MKGKIKQKTDKKRKGWKEKYRIKRIKKERMKGKIKNKRGQRRKGWKEK